MKTIAELNAVRDQTRQKMTVRENGKPVIRVVVGLATCGMAAGAGPVFDAFAEEVKKRRLDNVDVIRTGCIGMCQLEPIVEVLVPGKEKVTYGKMTPDKVASVVTNHLVNGNPVAEYTVGQLMK